MCDCYGPLCFIELNVKMFFIFQIFTLTEFCLLNFQYNLSIFLLLSSVFFPSGKSLFFNFILKGCQRKEGGGKFFLHMGAMLTINLSIALLSLQVLFIKLQTTLKTAFTLVTNWLSLSLFFSYIKFLIYWKKKKNNIYSTWFFFLSLTSGRIFIYSVFFFFFNTLELKVNKKQFSKLNFR